MDENQASQDASAPEAPAPQVVERVIEKEPESYREQVERDRAELKEEQGALWDKLNRNEDDEAERDERPKAAQDKPRDEFGKFTKAEPEPDEAKEPAKAEVEKDQPKAKGDEPKPAEKQEVNGEDKKAHSIEPPGHWDKSLKETFAKLPEDVAKQISEAGLKDRQSLTKLGQQLKQVEPTLQRLAAHEEAFKAAGVKPADAIDELMRVHQTLNANPAGALRELAQRFGVDLWSLADGTSQEASADPNTDHVRQEISDLKSQVAELKAEREALAKAEAERNAQNVQRVIDEFRADKQHFSTLEPLIAQEIAVLKESDPTLSHRELLTQAYERAELLHPEIRAENEAAKLAALEKERREKAAREAESAKKAAALNVRSSPDQSGDEISLRDAQRAVWRKLHS